MFVIKYNYRNNWEEVVLLYMVLVSVVVFYKGVIVIWESSEETRFDKDDEECRNSVREETCFLWGFGDI